MVLVVVVVVVKSWPGLGKYKSGVGARAGKYKLVARAVKYKLGARVGKCKLGARTGGQGQGPGLGPGAKQWVEGQETQRPFICSSVKRAYCSSLSDFGYKNESFVWKFGNTDLNFSIGIEPILKPLYLESR